MKQYLLECKNCTAPIPEWPTEWKGGATAAKHAIGYEDESPVDRAVNISIVSLGASEPPRPEIDYTKVVKKVTAEVGHGKFLPADGPWRITNVSGVTGAVPVAGATIGVGSHILTLENVGAVKTASYYVQGLVVGAGFDIEKIPFIGRIVAQFKGV